MGYHVVKRDRTTLDILGGMNFTHEDYVEILHSLGARQVREEFKLKIGQYIAAELGTTSNAWRQDVWKFSADSRIDGYRYQ